MTILQISEYIVKEVLHLERFYVYNNEHFQIKLQKSNDFKEIPYSRDYFIKKTMDIEQNNILKLWIVQTGFTMF